MNICSINELIVAVEQDQGKLMSAYIYISINGFTCTYLCFSQALGFMNI